jgi:dTDP-D-glucose 4,6-dehydratase
MRILLTGAGGFVGHHTLEHFLHNTDALLVCVDSFRHKGLTDRVAAVTDPRRVEVVTHDLTVPFSAQLRHRLADVTHVVSMASESHVERSIADPVPFVTNNVALTLNTLELARGLDRLESFIQVSTDEVYGPAPDGHAHGEWEAARPSNPYCLAPGTDVITPRGPVPIEEYDIARHRVLSRDGHKGKAVVGLASRTWQFDHVGAMYRIRVKEGGEEILATAEHKFFVRVAAHASGGSKVVERRAADLCVGDRVAVVRRIQFPPDLPHVAPAYARLLGYWIGDGSYSSRSRYVRLADQSRERLERYRLIAAAVCGVSPKSSTGAFGTIYRHGTKDCWYLQFASEQLRQRVDLGDKANVLDQALNFRPDALGEFIAGWIDADGSVSTADGRVNRAAISCYDPRQRRVLKYLLRRLGVIARDDDQQQRLTITDARSLHDLREAAPSDKWPDLPVRAAQRKKGRGQTWVWSRVEKVGEEPYDGKVYDLEVVPHHTYLAGYFLVHNSASKAAQDAISHAYWRTYGLPVVVTHTMNIIGERQDPEKFVPKVMSYVLAGDTIPIHGSADGRPGTRFYLHARNQADALLHIIETVRPALHADGATEPDSFNVVGEREVDNLTMARMVAETIGQSLRYELLEFHSARPGHDLRYALDGSKLAASGWKPPVPLEESLARTVRWTLAHREWLL